jgi:hypothetical protein
MTTSAAQPAKIEKAPPRARFVVCGPPASGKTTWVNQRRSGTSLAWDFDGLVAHMTSMPFRHRPAELIGAFEAMRDALCGWLATHPTDAQIFILIYSREKAKAIAEQIVAELVVLDTPEATCIDRVRRDPVRSRQFEKQVRSIRAWFHGPQPAPARAFVEGDAGEWSEGATEGEE